MINIENIDYLTLRKINNAISEKLSREQSTEIGVKFGIELVRETNAIWTASDNEKLQFARNTFYRYFSVAPRKATNAVKAIVGIVEESKPVKKVKKEADPIECDIFESL